MKMPASHFAASGWMRFRTRAFAVLSCIALVASSGDPIGAQTNTPVIVIDRAFATGVVVRSPKGEPESLTVEIRDTLSLQNFPIPGRDTVPAGAALEFHWHSEPRSPGVYAVEYQYKLDEASFVSVDTSVHSVRYESVQPGRKIFVVRVIDNEGARRETNRRFTVNYSPDTWISGPDLALLDARFGWTSPDERHLDIADWNALPDLSGTLLSCDSITVWPAERERHKTFFEIYGNRLYVRSEDDTVHLNSWVIGHFGGSDLDSPYDVHVDPSDPALEDTVVCGPNGEAKVLRPAGLVGSPVAFRDKLTEFLDPNGPLLITAFSNPYPWYDPNSPFREPRIAGYNAVVYSGRAYLWARAVDGHGNEDESVGSGYDVVRCADLGICPPYLTPIRAHELRHKVLTFYVNKPPYLAFDAPAFVPRPGHPFSGRRLELNLIADDLDPRDLSNGTPPAGGPTANEVLRWNVRIEGRNAAGQTVMYSPLPEPVFTPRIDVTVPDEIVDPDVTLHVQLCDCRYCETQPGTGRCVETAIPVRIPTGATPVLASLISATARPDRIELIWSVNDGGLLAIERRTAEGEWSRIGESRADASSRLSFVDANVIAGTRYGYRLALTNEDEPQYGGEAWVDVPAAFELALSGVRPNPARSGPLTIDLSLATDTPARIELLDIGGRRIVDRTLALGEGRHLVKLGASRVTPGVYLVRLTQESKVRIARVAVIE